MATTTTTSYWSWSHFIESTDWFWWNCLVIIEGAWILAWPWLVALFLGYLVGKCIVRPMEKKITRLEQAVGLQAQGHNGNVIKTEETLGLVKEMLVVITNLLSSSPKNHYSEPAKLATFPPPYSFSSASFVPVEQAQSNLN